VNKILRLLIPGCDRRALAREVETELRFHLEMQARDYERQGLTPEEARIRAALRFGDFSKIKTQCIHIGEDNDVRRWAMKILFVLAFVLGVVVRIISSHVNITHAGDILMAIGVLGSLLLYARKMARSRPEKEPLRLGIVEGFESRPRSFDEKGRTPFERVRGD
jgi:hypothetical protein